MLAESFLAAYKANIERTIRAQCPLLPKCLLIEVGVVGTIEPDDDKSLQTIYSRRCHEGCPIDKTALESLAEMAGNWTIKQLGLDDEIVPND